MWFISLYQLSIKRTIMKSNIIITVSLICVVVLGLFIFGYTTRGGTTASVQGTAEPNSSKSLLTTSEVLYDFGTISMKNGNVTKEFTVTNSTSNDIVLRKVETSCMCTSALLVEADGSTKGPFGMASMGAPTATDDTVKIGESRIVRVVYDPNAHGPAGVGKIDRFITLTDASGNTLQFEIKALVTP
jgi:hypothetical protein